MLKTCAVFVASAGAVAAGQEQRSATWNNCLQKACFVTRCLRVSPFVLKISVLKACNYTNVYIQSWELI